MRKNFKLTFILLLIVFSFIAIKRTDGFRTFLITKFKKYDPIWQIKIKNIDEIKTILNQKYYYLTRGRESFIFQSEDGKYILKFFDSSRYDVRFFFLKVPLPGYFERIRKKHYNRRIRKLDFNLSSARLAYDNLKDDAALVYVNLTQNDIFEKKVKVVNNANKEFEIDLKNSFFILQKKCDLFYLTYEKTSNIEKKQNLLKGFIKMVDQRTKKNIIDDDIGKKRRNWGILDNKVVTFDIGRWYFDEKLSFLSGYKKEMLKGTKILRKFLKENEPQNLIFFEKLLDEYILEFEKN